MTAAPDSPQAEKRCQRCNETKPLDDFHVCQTGTHGRAHWCKACYVQYNEDRKAERKAQRAADREAARQAKAAKRAPLAELEGRS